MVTHRFSFIKIEQKIAHTGCFYAASPPESRIALDRDLASLGKPKGEIQIGPQGVRV